MGLVGWLIAVGFFAIARNYQKAAQRESDRRGSVFEKTGKFFGVSGYLLVVLAPYVLAFACIYL